MITPERWKLDQLFYEALALPPDECDAFLNDACAGDDSLRHQVEALLSAHGKAGSFIEKPALEVEARSIPNDQTESAVGQTIGQYKIISQLGVGGMGEKLVATFSIVLWLPRRRDDSVFSHRTIYCL